MFLRVSLGDRTFAHLSARLARMLWGTRSVLLLLGMGKRKSPGKPVQLPGLTGQNTKPSKFVSAVRAAFPTNAV